MAADERPNTFQERALAVTIPGLGNVASSIKSGLSKLIQKLKLQWWQLRQKSPDDVFIHLKLDQTGNKLFESPAFFQWVAFVTVRDKSGPDMAMFNTLTKHYNDDALAKMLVAAKEVDNTRAIATTMEGLQLSKWISAGNSADEVFKSLQLHRAGDKLFESAVFPNWISFLTKRNSRDPDLEMFSTFVKHYSDDALAHAVIAAKKVSTTKDIATKVEGFQIANWAGSSADDVFTALKLNQAGDKLFESPLFAYWASFVAKQNNKDPGVEMFTTFTKHYSDDALAKIMPAHILARAKTIGSTKAMATKLEGLQQIPSWISAEKSADDVFKLLKLDQTGDKLFESPLLSVWTTFVAKINRENPDEVVIKQLANTFDDVPLARMISAATKVDNTQDLAGQLRTAQFNQWWSQRKTPQEVDTMLSVATNTDDVTKKISRDYEKFYGKIEAPPPKPKSRTQPETSIHEGPIRISG
ncbi:RxLR effector protein [Phytophthora megakarya]|uniref:RxLR effector protein n=1 Tax=Phytophthora megakarya TaxID=4795 RepID=A0A225VHE7_9STRA|nr:RxLR effector protein [Phytophthora megakarya]